MTRVARSQPVVAWPLGAALGEGPVWVARDQALWFVDIKAPAIHRFDPASDARRSWPAPAQSGFCVPAAGGGFVAGLQTGLARFDPDGGTFAAIVDPEPDRPGNRLNDAVIDPAGRLWFGTMDDAEVAATGRIYRLADDGRCIAETTPVAISNGPAISPDGRTLYHVDTLGGVIHAADIGADGGLSGSRVFAMIDPADGYPDGPAVDAEGCVWIGLYGGWAVRRYNPEGVLIETVRFPASAITKVAFGGPNLTTLFATTANKHLDAAGRAREPLAGHLFSVEMTVAGLPGHEVAVGL